MPIAVPYARVSDRRQAETLSIPTQLDYIRRWCELEELELGPAFVDAGESAKTADRTQLQRLLAYCRVHRSQVACVVVFRLDRWTRELRDYLVLSEELTRLGIPLRSVTESFAEDEDGEMHSLLTTLMAQWENRRKARRTREGMQFALQRGRWVWLAPLGYLNGSRGGPSLLPDPERASLVEHGFELVASGAMSALAALDRLHELGLRTRGGHRLSRQSWSNMLRNPVYKGRLVKTSWGIEADADFEPLATPDTWRRVQLALDGRLRGPSTRRRDHPDFPSAGSAAAVPAPRP
jgi:DNA invertase Pin-like site-specific DNA recombinase